MTTWLPSPVFPGRYEVSDEGRVRRRMREVPHRLPCGLVTTRVVRPDLLAVSYGGRNSKYHRVMLHGPGDERQFAYVHVLVCTAFHGRRPADTLCCHRNDIQDDNRADNLYWGTATENLNDKAVNSLVCADAGADADLGGVSW